MCGNRKPTNSEKNEAGSIFIFGSADVPVGFFNMHVDGDGGAPVITNDFYFIDAGSVATPR
ncbi:MAG: hypothetical protein B7Y56_07330 [Gallionellales bacterium 35-53-114]|jgi:hypothetical protein|nr:MAG: hypothetical protein B7Y56_07330 [Gallionellales bacterium 35-53-114]OYZ63989.1 MAG: hypothetical protein B7Y04_08425 [Gallionellales bacterium 24-53-125]OZB09182.1 MAG: hypothetical protein B7X61_05785 [Gallionellales bacterium 39-52-133]